MICPPVSHYIPRIHPVHPVREPNSCNLLSTVLSRYPAPHRLLHQIWNIFSSPQSKLCHRVKLTRVRVYLPIYLPRYLPTYLPITDIDLFFRVLRGDLDAKNGTQIRWRARAASSEKVISPLSNNNLPSSGVWITTEKTTRSFIHAFIYSLIHPFGVHVYIHPNIHNLSVRPKQKRNSKQEERIEL